MIEKKSDRPSRTDWARVRAMRDEDIPYDPDSPFLTTEELEADGWIEANSEEELFAKLRAFKTK